MPRNTHPVRLGIGLAFFLALATAACGGGRYAGEHRGHGVVERVDPAKGEVVIDHEDMPGFMMAMKMTFEVTDPAILEGVSPGQEVDFLAKEEGGHYIVTRIDPVTR